MKILTLSDTQIGSGQALADDRMADQEAMLTQIAKLAEAESVDLVLHCGDVFDKRHPSEEARIAFKRFSYRLSNFQNRRPLVVVAGNHDLRNATLPSAVDLYDDCAFVRQPEVRQFGDLFVACLPWVPLARLLANRDGDRSGIHEDAADLLIDIAADLRNQCGDGPAILGLHWMLSGASLPNGLPVEQLGSVVLPTAELEAQGWTAVFAGDIHVPQILSPGALSVDANGSHHAAGQPIISCGSPWVNDWGEAEIAHGVWLMDTGDVLDGVRYAPITDRAFVTVDVDLTATEGDIFRHVHLGLDETDAIAGAISEHLPLDGAVVRVRYRCTPEQARRVDVAALRGFLREAGVSKVFALAPEIVRADRARVEGVDENLGEREALGAWIAAQDPTVKRADDLRALGARLAEEVPA